MKTKHVWRWALLVATALVLMPPAAPAGAQQSCACPGSALARVVTVGGGNLVSDLLPPTPQTAYAPPATGYLYDSVGALNIPSFQICVCDWQWNGDAAFTSRLVPLLAAYLRSQYVAAWEAKQKFVIIGHGWGAVLAYLALITEAQKSDPVVVDKFITLGNPMGSQSAEGAASRALDQRIIQYTLQGLRAGAANFIPPSGKLVVRRWINYWSQGDPMSGPVGPQGGYLRLGEDFEDVQIDQNFYTNANPADCAAVDQPDGWRVDQQIRCRKRDMATLTLWHDLAAWCRGESYFTQRLAAAGITGGPPNLGSINLLNQALANLKAKVRYEIEEMFPETGDTPAYISSGHKLARWEASGGGPTPFALGN